MNIAGGASFDKVMQSIGLMKKHRVKFNTLTVITPNNSGRPKEVYNFLKSIGSGFLQFIPIVERLDHSAGENDLQLVGPEPRANTAVTAWSVLPEAFGQFLITIFDEWVRTDVGRVFVQIFDVTLANWVGQPGGLCVFEETCGGAMVMEHNGDLYSCDHYVYAENKLGNIKTTNLRSLANSVQQHHFGNIKLIKLPPYCIQCDYRFACHGECPKHRFEVTPDGDPGLTYLCTAYKMFFAYVHPYMQFMGDELAARRAPANVMAWAQRYKRYEEAVKGNR